MLNSNDLFAQIGFIVDYPQKSSPRKSKDRKYVSNKSKQHSLQAKKYKTIEQQFQKPQYVTSLQIELSENENHVLQIKSFDDPYTLAAEFCKKHNLNYLAVQIVQKKIIQAKQKQQLKILQKKAHIKHNNLTPSKYQKVAQRVPQNNCNQQFLKNTPYKRAQEFNVIQQNVSRSFTPGKIPKQSQLKKQNKNAFQHQKTAQNISGVKHQRTNTNLGKACQQLYWRGQIQAKALQQKRIKRQQQRQKEEQQQLTFKPKINEVSEKIVEFRKQTGTVKPKNPNKAKRQLAEIFYKQLQQCTFTPQINQISKLIVHNRSAYRNQNQHFSQLFGSNDQTDKNSTQKSFSGNQTQYLNKKSKQYLKKQQQISQKQLFKPKLNHKSIQRIRQPFNVRLQKAIQIKQKIKQGDFANDQYTFQPKVGRSPYYQPSRAQNFKSNKENIPVWEQLYQQSQSRAKLKQKLQQKKSQASKTNKTNQSFSNFQSLSHNNSKHSLTFSSKATSNLHYQNLIQKRINLVFQLLDSDSDGMISPNTIGIQNLSKNTLIFLKPIFEQMDELNAELNYNQFKKAVINLLNDSDPYKKGLFLSDNSKKKADQLTFNPRINPKSKQIAGGRNTSQIHVQLYQQGVKNLQRKQFMLQKQRAKKYQKQLQQCSFKPSLKLGEKSYKPYIFDRQLQQMQHEIDLQESNQKHQKISSEEYYGSYEIQY